LRRSYLKSITTTQPIDSRTLLISTDVHTGIQILIPDLFFMISCYCSSVQISSCWDGQQRMRQCTVKKPELWEDRWRMVLNCMLSYKSPILV